MSEEIKLLPCPFCQTVPHTEANSALSGGRVVVTDCVRPCPMAGRYVPVEQWNLRAHDGDGWRDIESAPKDRTRILIAPHMMTGWWEFGDDEWMVLGIPLNEDKSIAYDWTVRPKLFFCLYAKQFGVEPTHWRPLPAPPQFTLEQEKRG